VSAQEVYVELTELPVQVRAEAARRVIREEGADPYLALAAAVWPSQRVIGTLVTPDEDYCSRGHRWTEENTYWSPGGGRRKCRECNRGYKRKHTSTHYRNRKKEPCVHCGEPATAAVDKGTGGLPTPRCRRCFLEEYKRRRRAA
jgi:hypothetical protein